MSEPQPRVAGDGARTRSGQARRPTIYDVAQLAGVNPSTVSRALSTPGRISAKTEARIHEAARALQFQINPMARALQTGRTNTLGLLIADITNPMFFDVARGAEREAAERGYTLVISESQESGSREVEAADRIIRSVDGIILVSTRLSDEEIVALSARTPLVVLNRGVDGVDALVPDVATGIDQAVAHLAGLGHRSIAYVAGPPRSWMSRAREGALRAAAARRDIELVVIGPGEPTREGGAATLPRIIASGTTAAMTYNDLMAIGLLGAAAEAQLSVPGDLSVIGFDDIFGADFTSPTLTTIRTPLARMGELAVRRILDRLDGSAEHRGLGTDPLETDLVIRRSTARERS
jgi:LacI family transcriptional regulator